MDRVVCAIKDILATIDQMRRERGWTEYRLAEESGLPQTTISSWYRSTKKPSVYSLEKICQAFGITMAQLFSENSEPVELTESQRQMLDRWSRLTPAQQEAFLRLLDVL